VSAGRVAPSTRAGAGVGIHRQRQPLVRVGLAGSGQLTGTVVAWVHTPTSRLRCGVSLAYESDTPHVITSYASAAWTITAMREGTGGGREAELHALVTAQALPNMYELDSSIRLLRVSCDLTVPQPSSVNPSSLATSGNWVLVAEWEPNMAMCDEDVLAFYNQCSANIGQTTAPLSGPGA